jgi:nicotinate-nucleotide--dimethylbenzimidazole phosphoribosyltransferase
MTSNKSDSNDAGRTPVTQACGQCGVEMKCGANASACWCQDFANLEIDPTRTQCSCESCLRINLAAQREHERAKRLPLVQQELAKKTMPTGALGQLQTLAAQLALIQNTLTPKVSNVGLIIFAGDHGLADEGVSAYPKSVTWQMVMNFLGGGAAINVLARSNSIHLQIVDAGVDHDFQGIAGLINAKVASGTQSSQRQAAMTSIQFDKAWASGARIATSMIKAHSLHAIGFGEMGIGNTSAASLLLSLLLSLDLGTLIGRGTGVDDDKLTHKINVIRETHARITQVKPTSPKAMALECAGFEIVMMAGAMQKAADLGVAFVVDGFIATSAYALARAIDKDVAHYAIFAHCSNEAGHRKALQALNAEPLLDLGLRLGEGSGAALAMPLLRSAAAIMSEMATFESAAVANKA